MSRFCYKNNRLSIQDRGYLRDGGGLRGCQAGQTEPSSLGCKEEVEISGQRPRGWRDSELPGAVRILTASGFCVRVLWGGGY